MIHIRTSVAKGWMSFRCFFGNCIFNRLSVWNSLRFLWKCIVFAFKRHTGGIFFRHELQILFSFGIFFRCQIDDPAGNSVINCGGYCLYGGNFGRALWRQNRSGRQFVDSFVCRDNFNPFGLTPHKNNNIPYTFDKFLSFFTCKVNLFMFW